LIALVSVAIVAVAACSASGAATDAGAVATAAGPTAAPGGGTTATDAPTDAAVTTPAPAGDSIDVCGLLTAADLKTATGKDYGEGVADPAGGCAWNVGTSGVNQGDLVYAITQPQSLDFIKSAFIGGSDVTVSGHAGYWHPGIGLGSMWVDIGGRVFVLSFPRSAELTAEDQAAAQKLAEIAVGRM
jgi:hypothetical protein